MQHLLLLPTLLPATASKFSVLPTCSYIVSLFDLTDVLGVGGWRGCVCVYSYVCMRVCVYACNVGLAV